MARGTVAENIRVRRAGAAAPEDELQVLAEAQVQHLVGLVEHAGPEARKVEVAPLDVVAQAPGRAHHDVGPALQRPTLPALVHAPDAGGDMPAGPLVEPAQLARDLHRKLARGRDGEGQRRAYGPEARLAREDLGRHGEAKGHRLARPGLGRHEKVAPPGLRGEDGLLDGGQAA
jgi:hypothetical protein